MAFLVTFLCLATIPSAYSIIIWAKSEILVNDHDVTAWNYLAATWNDPQLVAVVKQIVGFEDDVDLEFYDVGWCPQTSYQFALYVNEIAGKTVAIAGSGNDSQDYEHSVQDDPAGAILWCSAYDIPEESTASLVVRQVRSTVNRFPTTFKLALAVATGKLISYFAGVEGGNISFANLL